MNPHLEMTGAGLQHDTGLVAVGPHRFEYRWCSPVQIEQNVAVVSVLCVGPDVDITTLTVTNPQKPDSEPRSYLVDLERVVGGIYARHLARAASAAFLWIWPPACFCNS